MFEDTYEPNLAEELKYLFAAEPTPIPANTSGVETAVARLRKAKVITWADVQSLVAAVEQERQQHRGVVRQFAQHVERVGHLREAIGRLHHNVRNLSPRRLPLYDIPERDPYREGFADARRAVAEMVESYVEKLLK